MVVGPTMEISWSGSCHNIIRELVSAVQCIRRQHSTHNRDHVASAQLGFPCLQQISFDPTKAGLIMNSFYATQQIFDKAYGNYLGLARLGAFMAHEMGIPLAQINVMVGIAKLERIAKRDSDLVPVVAAANALVRNRVVT